jgi:hypothetical protein
MTQKKKNKRIFPKIEKELKDFMADDQGKMTRKDVAKLGVSLAVLGMMMQTTSSEAQTTHTNTITPGPASNCATHVNVTTNVTHSDHSDHGTGGWSC